VVSRCSGCRCTSQVIYQTNSWTQSSDLTVICWRSCIPWFLKSSCSKDYARWSHRTLRCSNFQRSLHWSWWASCLL
jgi:hypothetical protein